jgi:hypothetical protein
MVHVRLDRGWTDGNGVSHASGDTVDVDAATLAAMEADGVVDEDWAGPGKPPGDDDKDGWAGPGKIEP